MARTELLKSQP